MAGTNLKTLKTLNAIEKIAASGRSGTAKGHTMDDISESSRPRLLLEAWAQGDQAAFNELLPLVHDELHRLARRHMNRERRGHTLQATALVNEA
jgi:hypothetical protein